MTTLRDVFQKATNLLREPIDDKWRHLPNDDRREIARELADNIDIIGKYLGPDNKDIIKAHPSPIDIIKEPLGLINRENWDQVYKLLKYIETYSIYEQLLTQQPQPQQNYINKSTVFRYINALRNLEKIIEDIKDGHLSSLPQYPNVAKPNNNYIEIVFGIKENRKKQKETLIEILEKAIGKIMARGYPAFYYNPSMYNNADLPLIYYVQLDDNSFFQRFFINEKNLPQKTAGHLLYELSNIIQTKRKSLILPNVNQYYIIKDFLGRDLVAIDRDPNGDPYILKSLPFFYERQEFPT